MDPFPFNKFQSRNIAVAVIVYGGPAVSFDGLSVFQQNLFLNQLFEKNIRDFENYITQHTDPRDWYLHYVHHTSIATPIYIVVVRSGSIVMSMPITNVQDMATKFASVTDGVNVFAYSKEDSRNFNRYVLNKCFSGEIISDNHIRTKPYVELVHDEATFDTLDEHICYLNMKTGEFVNSPHYLYINAVERLKESTEEKALSFWKISQEL
jgi:hypothetical protein